MHRQPDPSSIAAPHRETGLTVLLASGALALMLLIASGMHPWPERGTPAAASPSAVPAGEPTLVERTRHQVVTGA